jgi:hypothetical protein
MRNKKVGNLEKNLAKTEFFFKLPPGGSAE